MFFVLMVLTLLPGPAAGEGGARLLRQPDISATRIAFVHGGDIWTAPRSGGAAQRLTRTAESESYPRFSPDGRLIAFTRLGDVYVLPAEGGAERRLTWHPQFDTAVGWTPDGRHVVIHSDRWRGAIDASPHVFLVPAEGGWPEPLPVPRATRATFAPGDGRFAYGPFVEVALFFPWRGYRGGGLGHIAVYDPAGKKYFDLPRGDWNDIAPIWRGDHIYFLSDRDGTLNLYRYSLAAGTTTKLTSYTEWDVRDPGASQDAIIYENGGWLYTLDLATGVSHRLSVDLPPDAVPRDSDRATWRQALEDAWRIYAEKAFQPAKAWAGIKPRYLELMASAAHWSDADAVLRQMLSEAGQSHIVLMRPEPEAPPSNTGLLGADFRVENGHYRVTRVYGADPSGEKQSAPLAGAGVREGDYILAIGGKPASPSSDIHSHLAGRAGSEVKLLISDSPGGAPREVTVQPIADERALRYFAWTRANAKRVAAASGGRIGYLHCSNVDKPGVEKFRREWRGLRGKVDAVIIDERSNTGGTQPLDVLDWIERPPARMMFDRRGQVPPFIGPFIDGPKVMLANELSVSGGDELAFYFKERRLGTLVGTRTMGGMIGQAGRHAVAGGWVMAIPELAFFWPEFNRWAPENHGVEPDIRVEWTPADYAAARDPQLEKAIEAAAAALKTYRKQIPEIPPYGAGR